MKILILNSGSSSLKCQYFINQKSVASIVIERIGEEESQSFILAKNTKKKNNTPLKNHHDAIQMLFTLLETEQILTSIHMLDAVGHRIVHGGNTFNTPVKITTERIEEIRALIPLAPLHNPANLEGIEVLHTKYPELLQVAVFDTAFHQTMPKYASLYPLPYDLNQTTDIRRYGFHGTSHYYVAKEAAKLLEKPLKTVNLITLHLGNGASVTAIKSGKSIDTSMGMTPLEGLMMGTRCGDIDPAIIPYLEKQEGMSISQIDTMLNTQSGLKGICGTNDMREVLQRASQNDTKAQLALEMYIYRIKKYIGAYTVALEKVDALVFTGGIGEHAAQVRELICAGLYNSIGIEIDKEKNNDKSERSQEIQSIRSKVQLFIILTNEELEIALQTEQLIRGEVSF